MMPNARGWLSLTVMLAASGLATPSSSHAQDTLCARVLQARAMPRAAGMECFQLANSVDYSAFAIRLLEARTAPRDLQSRTSGEASAPSQDQGEALPSVQPVALAGVSLSALGGASGSTALIALSLNPLTIARGGGATKSVSATRTMDATLFLPATTADSATNGRPDYWGVRLRLDLSSLRGLALRQVATRFGESLAASTAAAERFGAVLSQARDPGRCFDAVNADSSTADDVTQACGRSFSLDLDTESYARYRESLARLRDSVDASYVGFDLRAEGGDPSLGAQESFSVRSLYAAVAGGRRAPASQEGMTEYGLRFRAGVQVFSVDSGSVVSEKTDGSIWDLAIGAEAMVPQDFKPIRVQAALEYRDGQGVTTALREALQLGGLAFRVSAEVPIRGADGITVSYVKPFDGDLNPRLAISYSIQALLGAR